jgi:dipeptide/tripeptide permease
LSFLACGKMFLKVMDKYAALNRKMSTRDICNVNLETVKKPCVACCCVNWGFFSGTEICERMATLGLQRNLVTYFTTEIHMSNPQAANMVSNFVGTLYLTPFIGGFAADGE